MALLFNLFLIQILFHFATCFCDEIKERRRRVKESKVTVIREGLFEVVTRREKN
jgi:hypothetical protein